MDHFSFQGPYAYRWVNDVPVERIHLSSGEHHAIEIGDRCLLPAPRGAAAPEGEQAVRAAMAAWN
jgi:hypothetical protein